MPQTATATTIIIATTALRCVDFWHCTIFFNKICLLEGFTRQIENNPYFFYFSIHSIFLNIGGLNMNTNLLKQRQKPLIGKRWLVT
jgi:hypothetical protein